MTKTEAVIRSIMGVTRADIRPLAYAVDIAAELMFVRKISMDDLFVTNHIYPDAAKRLRQTLGISSSPKAVSRRIERLANRCWENLVSKNLVEHYIGIPLHDIDAPRDIIFYLAYYVYLDTPFYVAMKQNPCLLF